MPVKGSAQEGVIFVLHLAEGEPDFGCAPTEQGHRGLDGDGVDLDEQRVDQVEQPELQRGALRIPPVERELRDVVRLARHDVGQHGDDPDPSERHDGRDLVVVAAVNRKVVPARGGGLRDLRDVARRLLDSDDALVLCKLRVCRHSDVKAGARRHVVEYDRLVGHVGCGEEVLYQPLLRRLVIIGRDEQQRVGPNFAGIARERNFVVGIVCAGSGDHRHASRGVLDREFYHRAVFLIGQRRRLAGRADRDYGVGPAVDLPVDDTAKRLIIDCAVFHRGDYRDSRSGEYQRFT